MQENRSILESLGGPRRAILLAIAFVGAAGFYHWQSAGSGAAMEEVGAALGLQVSREGKRFQLNGRIDEIGVRVATTTDHLAGETRWFTDFRLYAPGQPHGRIVGAGLRQKVIDSVQGAQRLSTGDAGFDEAVWIEGEPEEILPHLDDEARVAVRAAVDAGWTLESVTWSARESGRMTSAERMRFLLDTGLAAARAMMRSAEKAGASGEAAAQ